jgi:hypothetical protein
VTITPPSESFATPEATFSRTGEISLTPQATFSRPEIVPTLQIPVGSSAAEVAVTSFASIHLGIDPTLLYAGDLKASASTASGKLSADGTAALEAILSQLPAEVQTFIDSASSASGAVYWGVWQTGAGVVAAGDCTSNPNCTVSIDNLSFYIMESAAGVDAVYTTGAPANATDALNMILGMYPGLTGLTFEPSSVESGYAFQAAIVDLSAGSDGQRWAAYRRLCLCRRGE